jgi:hypothetical protein
MLVVKGLTAAKAKVTWGATTKEYTSDQLAKGINLASEFLQNPFSGQFGTVHNAVEAQESQEDLLSKTVMHESPGWAGVAPGAAPLLNQIIAQGMAQHEALYKAAADLVIPVEHTITIVPEP